MDCRKLGVQVFVLVLLMAGGAQAGMLKVHPDLLEFGTLTEGPAAKKVVTLTNAGNMPLSISNVTTSCSCTTTALEKNELKPGESTGLKITYNTYKFPGKFQKYVNVFWGNGDGEKAVITLLGAVNPIPMGVLEASPRKVEAGEMVPGKPVRLELSLKNTGNADMTVTSVMSRNTGMVYYDGATNGPMRIKPGTGRNVSITETAPAPGDFLDLILVYSDARNVTDQGFKVVVMGTAR
jgi:hypothetical protein